MRIAHITATFPPYYSGTGLVCYHNALELARRGHDVTVFTAAYPPGEYPYPPEITVKRLPVLFRVGNAPVLPGLLQLRGFDLIHLHYPFYSGAELTALAAWLTHTPLVITYHQDVILKGWLKFVSAVHDGTLGAWTLGLAVKVLFTTLDYAQHSQAAWLLARAPNRSGALPNGVDIARFRPDLNGSEVRQRYGISAEACVFILVAGLDRAHYFKGVEVLFAALAQVAAPRLHLLIVGDGDLRAHYAARAEALGVSARVVFAGRVGDEALPLHYAAADISVLPSTTLGEAFGLTLIEAMACGKPVIASNLPGVRAVVSDGEDGLLAEPGNATDLAEKIQTLINNPLRRRAMGQRGQAKVEAKYAWPKVVEHLEEVYQNVLTDVSVSPTLATERHAR